MTDTSAEAVERMARDIERHDPPAPEWTATLLRALLAERDQERNGADEYKRMWEEQADRANTAEVEAHNAKCALVPLTRERDAARAERERMREALTKAEGCIVALYRALAPAANTAGGGNGFAEKEAAVQMIRAALAGEAARDV